MDQLAKLAALIVPSLALLGFIADSARRTRAAMRESLELADQFDHDPEIARRLRARASALAAEYLDEAEAEPEPYPRRVTLAAWFLATISFVAVSAVGLLPHHPSTGVSLAYGCGIAAMAYALRRPLDAALNRLARRRAVTGPPPSRSTDELPHDSETSRVDSSG